MTDKALMVFRVKKRIDNMKIGFIGGGNMAFAIASGIVEAGLILPSDIWVNDIDTNAHLKFTEKNINVSTELSDVMACDYIILAVKPGVLPLVLSSISSGFKGKLEDKVFISIAAGISVSNIKKQLSESAKVVRIMPNTPALVKEGMSVIAAAQSPVTDNEFNNVVSIFSSVGQTEVLPESMLNSVIAISSSSPAYIFMLIEAMADAGVRDGISRNIAYKLAAQSVLGSAKMVLETKKHPGELKDMVCSPSGTTINAVEELEKCGFRSSIISAMKKCTDKANNI